MFDKSISLEGPFDDLLQSDNTTVAISEVEADSDGVYRWYPLVKKIGQIFVPTILFAAFLRSNLLEAKVNTDKQGLVSSIDLSDGRKIIKHIIIIEMISRIAKPDF